MKHGTYGAYQNHKKLGIVPIDIWCTIANRIRADQQRRRGKCVNGLGWPAEIPESPGSLYPWKPRDKGR